MSAAEWDERCRRRMSVVGGEKHDRDDVRERETSAKRSTTGGVCEREASAKRSTTGGVRERGVG